MTVIITVVKVVSQTRKLCLNCDNSCSKAIDWLNCDTVCVQWEYSVFTWFYSIDYILYSILKCICRYLLVVSTFNGYL